MKISLRLLAVIFVLSFATSIRAGDFVTQVVQASQMFTIKVPADRFLVIRNFTQEGTIDPGPNQVTTRGIITAMDTTGLSGTVIVASIADTDPVNILEPVNNVAIAGPSTVTVTGGNTSCVLTYRMGDD